MCGGASQQQKALAQQQSSFAATLRQSFEKRFGGQTEILEKLNKALTPILSAGPGGRGFSSTEKRLAEARIADRTAAQYEGAAKAVAGQLAGRGGDAGLISGVDAQIRAALAGESAKTQSEAQTQLELADFAAGREQFGQAAQGMLALSGQYDPQNFGAMGTQAGQSAFGMQKDIDAQKGQFWKTLASGLTGIASAGIGALTGGATTTGSFKPSYPGQEPTSYPG